MVGLELQYPNMMRELNIEFSIKIIGLQVHLRVNSNLCSRVIYNTIISRELPRMSCVMSNRLGWKRHPYKTVLLQAQISTFRGECHVYLAT